MALAAVVDTIDTIPEALRTEYTEKDGKFYLNVDGLDNHHGVTGLKTALGSERQANKALKDLKAKYDSLGLSHEEIEALISKDATAAAEALRKKGDVEGILKQHQTKWEKEKGELTAALDGANTAARVAIVDASITSALGKAKVTPEGAALLPAILGKRVDLTIANGKPVHKIVQADGETAMAGSGSDGLATYDDLIAEAKKSFPSLFEGTGAGGGGTPPKGGQGGAKTISRGEFEKLGPVERAEKIRGGFKLVD